MCYTLGWHQGYLGWGLSKKVERWQLPLLPRSSSARLPTEPASSRMLRTQSSEMPQLDSRNRDSTCPTPHTCDKTKAHRGETDTEAHREMRPTQRHHLAKLQGESSAQARVRRGRLAGIMLVCLPCCRSGRMRRRVRPGSQNRKTVYTQSSGLERRTALRMPCQRLALQMRRHARARQGRR